ncbi:MAG: hypothetical protein KC620_13845 [Myxococcales bacterium]|nr:hypothetical protein [Myxococcales bacterium]
MHRTLRPLAAVLLLAAQHFACEADPIPGRGVSDSLPPTDQFVRDSFDPDFQVIDAQPDMPPVIDAEPDMRDMMVVDAEPDQTVDAEVPVTPAPRAQVAVLAGRLDAQVAWISRGNLYRKAIDVDAIASGRLPDERLERRVRVASLGGYDGPLTGARTSNGDPWVFVGAGPDGMMQGFNLGQPVAQAQALELWPPFVVGAQGDVLLLVGRSAADPTSPVAWRVIDASGLSARRTDQQGISVPLAVTTALDNWVAAFDDGVCQQFFGGTGGALTPGGVWPCAMRSGDQLIGDGARLHAVGQVGPDVMAWTLMPGAHGQPMPVEVEGDPRLVVVAANATMGPVLNRLPGALVLPVDGEEDAIFLIGDDEISRIAVLDANAVFGAITYFQATLLVRWPEGASAPLAESAQIADRREAPAHGLDCRRPAPETCELRDYDCDGSTLAGRCCPVPEAGNPGTEVRFRGPPTSPWFIAKTDDGLLLAYGFGGRVEVARPREGRTTEYADLPILAAFEGIERPLEYSNYLSRLMVRGRLPAEVVDTPDAGVEADAGPDAGPDAEPDAGPPAAAREQILFYAGQGADGPVTAVVDPPCDTVLHISLRNEAGRVFCPDEAFDLLYDRNQVPPVSQVVRVPYPDGVIGLRWVGPTVAEDGAEVFVAAAGDDYALHQWRQASDGTLTVDELPAVLAAMETADRTLPMRPPQAGGVRAARVHDGFVEVYLPERGWRRGVSSRWPVAATFSRYEPVAFSVAQVINANTPATDPESPDYQPAQRRVSVFMHSLREGELHWGQALTLKERVNHAGRQVHGVLAAEYGEQRGPTLWWGFGENTVGLEPFYVSCRAASQ